MPYPTYKPGEAESYARERSWPFKTSGDELILASCPFCTKKDKLYWNNVSGAYQCKSAQCGQAGNYFTLRRDLGDPVPDIAESATPMPAAKRPRRKLSDLAPFEQALLDHPEAMAYLTNERGLTVETIKKWHLGLKREEAGQHQIEDYDSHVYWLMIPYITQQGDVGDVKYRTLPPAPKRFKRWQGGNSILFGEHLLPKKKGLVEELFLVEGELDAITLDQHGFTYAISTTTGAGSFSPRWYDLIVSSGAKRLVIIYDSDVDGRAGAEKLVAKFNDEDRKVLDVILEDAKDSNEYFLSHTAEEFRELIGTTRPAEMEHCISAATVLDRLEKQIFLSGGQFNGIPSLFSSLNELMAGGYGNGKLTTLLGGSGTGKTSFMIQEMCHIGATVGPVYLCCLEMDEMTIMQKIINHLYHIPINKITQDHIREYRPDIERRNLYFGSGIRRTDQLMGTFTKAAKRYDLKKIIFDNIHYLVRSAQHESSEISLATRTLKDLAMDLGIPITAIAQPNKFNRSERIINENDAKGSAAIEQDSDNMMMMWRPTMRTDIKDFGKTMGQKENMSPLTLFRNGKSRFSGGGEALLYFHGEIGTFRQMSQEETDRLKKEAE